MMVVCIVLKQERLISFLLLMRTYFWFRVQYKIPPFKLAFVLRANKKRHPILEACAVMKKKSKKETFFIALKKFLTSRTQKYIFFGLNNSQRNLVPNPPNAMVFYPTTWLHVCTIAPFTTQLNFRTCFFFPGFILVMLLVFIEFGLYM